MKKIKIVSFLLLVKIHVLAQGITNIWQLGYDSGTFPACSLSFASGVPISTVFNRPMNMAGTSTTISDSNGNLLFYTNGIYVANANNDTMQNGSGLNPGMFTDAWETIGLPIFQGILALPWPDSVHKYLLLHETLNYDVNVNYRPKEILYSTIDMNLDGGSGGVSQKNISLINDTLDGGMLTACKHGNGRDWWILIRKYMSDVYFSILFTPYGIASINTQHVGGPISIFGGQAAFSPDGNWFATFDNQSKLRIYNFNRCTGLLDTLRYIMINDSIIAGSVQFSPNSQILYITNALHVYQFDLTAVNIAASQTLIATYDGYYSPSPPFQCDFFWQMTGPDGKIYINSGASVVDLHVINYPDSLDTLCNLQQHSFYMGAFNKNTFPNHVNYQLGVLANSPCDTLGLGTSEDSLHHFNFTVFPNPVFGSNLDISYQLPQHKEGIFQIFDINAKCLFKMKLPKWSSRQKIILPPLPGGLYSCIIISDKFKVSKKIIYIKE